MLTYTDLFSPNLFLVTNYTVGGEVVLATELMMRVLRTILIAVQKQHSFRVVGYVFLPAHLRLLVEPVAGSVLDQVMAAVQQQFHTDYQQLVGIPGDALLWEQRYHSQRMSSVDDLALWLDILHYEPVHHGLVEQPAQWPYSSYRGWLAQGLYPAEWGWSRPARLVGKVWR